MSRIKRVEAFQLEIPRDKPYLGELRPGETINERGYFVRGGNRTVYPATDKSIILRLETDDGIIGWGETYGIVAPGAVLAIIRDLFTVFLVGRDPLDVSVIYEDLYDLMRVRGYDGGFYHDALAAVDIALWDICGKIHGVPVAKLLGGLRHERLPGYVSGLPGPNEQARAELALSWQAKGFNQFKFAGPAVDDVALEFKTLREALGPTADIAADLHWAYTDIETIALAHRVLPYNPWFIEAPVHPEDINGLAEITRRSPVPTAAGEEWRHVFDVALRIEKGAPSIVQPEMGHVGITQFMRMSQYAQAHHRIVMPHATIGLGIFLAASIQASAAVQAVAGHEFQHTIIERTGRFIEGEFVVEKGAYVVPQRPGIGVEPTAEAIKMFKE
ncbi:MAG TPA: mandelate racemase/muconate lactonizing enzyme family protein [Devosiaceae bacterium]|jgi:galactonate dehydratase